MPRVLQQSDFALQSVPLAVLLRARSEYVDVKVLLASRSPNKGSDFLSEPKRWLSSTILFLQTAIKPTASCDVRVVLPFISSDRTAIDPLALRILFCKSAGNT